MKDVATTIRLLDSFALTGLRIALILAAAWVLAALLGRLTRAFHERVKSHVTDVEAIKRAETLNRVLRYTANVALSLIAVMLVLSELGISLAPILGAAGIVGIAVGFGAQSLVKDYFTGFCILLENQIRQGDVVEVAGKSGLVEGITLRFVRLRDYEGNVHFVPNGLITTVTNRSRGFAHAVIDVGIGYDADVDNAFEVMRSVAGELRADPAFAPKILDDLEIAGVENLTDYAVMLRGRMRVVPLEQWSVRREYLRRLVKAFADAGIEIPYPQMRVFGRKEGKAILETQPGSNP